MSEKIIAYKAMDKNMQCRGKQYEVGKTYHEDKADCCHAGMHACENPLDVLHYYPLKDGPRFFEVECGGNVDKSEEDSKLACTELTVKGELNFAGLVKATVNAVFNRVKGKEPFSSGYTVRLVRAVITVRRQPLGLIAEQKHMEKTMLQSQTAHTVRHGVFLAAIWC